MFREPKASIVVPVYNVERFLSRCIESIINQTYKNLEIILVNDGSTDSSGSICDQYAKKDSRIRVIHKNNEGLGPTRNVGMTIATGKWLFFVDSDDFCEPEMCEIAVRVGEKNNADIVMFDYFICRNNIRAIHNCYNEGFLLSEKNDILQLQRNLFSGKCFEKYTGRLAGVAWNKVYRMQFLNENSLSFHIKKFGEDNLFIFEALSVLQTFIYVKKALYNYSQNPSSIMHSYEPELPEMTKELYYEWRSVFDRQNLINDYEALICKYIFEHMSSAWFRLCLFHPQRAGTLRDKIHETEKLYKSEPFSIIIAKAQMKDMEHWHHKLLLFCGRHSIWGLYFLRMTLDKFSKIKLFL